MFSSGENNNLNHYYDDLLPGSDFLLDVKYTMEEADNYLHTRIQESSYQEMDLQYHLAIVLDIDETSLSHYPSFKQTQFANDPETIDARYHAASSPAIMPVLDFYQKAIKNNATVFFVSARKPLPGHSRAVLEEDTIKNLKTMGYDGTDYSKNLYLAKNEDAALSTQVFKTKVRQEIETLGYKIILNIGDQDSDLAGGYAEKTIKIPNYLYPSTLPASFKSIVSKKDYLRTLT